MENSIEPEDTTSYCGSNISSAVQVSSSSESDLVTSGSQPPNQGVLDNCRASLSQTVRNSKSSNQHNPEAEILVRTNALVIIDVQNEFLSTRGNFPIHETCRLDLIKNLQLLIPRFRRAGGAVVWVNAVYEDLTEEPAAMTAQARGDGIVGSNPWLVAATHVHPVSCCAAGTWGAAPYPAVFALAEPADTVLSKGAYSAFRGTTALREALRSRGATDVFFAGCASGTCVLASVLDAVRIGEARVHVVPDCLGWRRRNTHEEALRRFGELGVGLVESGEVGFGGGRRSPLAPARMGPSG
ncbi:isochorismatase family protein family [Diplocarpon mali]|nr:isochorismatase family protein family [Diplocarpon mali]